MANEIFTPMEIDAIGEIMNISLGSSATAVSNLLDHRVDITTPTVRIVNAEDFTLGELNPAIGVEIRYVAGLDGSNIMLLKMSDVKLIVDLLMGMETPDEEFELNDLTLSAVCEVMNQMMGSSSTALSDFLGRVVNISTPVTFDGSNIDQMREEHLPVKEGPIVVVSFALSIEGSMSSEFMNVMSVELAKELVSGFGLGEGEDSSGVLEAEIEDDSGGRPMSQEEIEAMMAAAAGAAAPAPAPAAAPAYGMPPGWMEMQQQMQQQMQMQMQQMQQQMAAMQQQALQAQQAAAKPDPKVIATKAPTMPTLADGTALTTEETQNLDLIMGVSLEIAVEIGRTRKKVQDILALSKGSLVVLDKLAGDQVDVFVNGKCIAHGDVVVIDDNFGIRISEIVQKPSLDNLT